MARTRRHHHGTSGPLTPPTQFDLTVNVSGPGKVTASGIDTPKKPWRGGGTSVGTHADQAGDMSLLNYEWYYNWTSTANPNVTDGTPFVPMIFRWNSPIPSSLNVSDPTDNYLLGFNEPDAIGAGKSTGTALSYTDALDIWPDLMATGRQLGSPANTTGATQWRSNFMSGAHTRGYRVDFMCIHWYQEGGTATDLKNYLNNVYANYGGNIHSPWYGTPIWLTEFDAYNGTVAANQTLAQNAGTILRTLPFVHRIGWFTNRSIAGGPNAPYTNMGLVQAGGTNLTTVGTAYKNWVNPVGDKVQTYNSGTAVHPLAIPDAGSTFTGWSGALTGSTNPGTITMNADKTLTATFA